MALVRGDSSSAEALADISIERTNVWGVGALAARLDMLAALHRRELIEREATALLKSHRFCRRLRFARSVSCVETMSCWPMPTRVSRRSAWSGTAPRPGGF
jgi:hypothetical protein